LAQFNELSEEWQDRIAGMTRRNETIVRQYLDNRAKYGKTLIFAINVPHAALLANDLKNEGVKAEYVASWRPDDEVKDNLAIIQDFRDGRIDVLVNVQILTEGVDVPTAKTAFLTRPTSSEILLRQMIGRVLRGPRVGGSEVAYLVSFEDHWERFRDWEEQFDLVPDIVESAPKPEEPKAAKEDVEVAPLPLVEALPWDLIKSVAAEIRGLGSDHRADAFEAVPFGWFVLEHTAEGEAVEKILPVYEHQFPSWDALFDRLSKLSAKELTS
jgi:superfamily II DNA or RNA helicase